MVGLFRFGVLVGKEDFPVSKLAGWKVGRLPGQKVGTFADLVSCGSGMGTGLGRASRGVVAKIGGQPGDFATHFEGHGM